MTLPALIIEPSILVTRASAFEASDHSGVQVDDRLIMRGELFGDFIGRRYCHENSSLPRHRINAR